MANKTFKDFRFKIDNAAGSLTDITAYVNSDELAGDLNLLEDTAESDEERTYLPGVAGATVTVSGFVNSTTEGIYGPLIGNRSSITKTVEYQHYTARYHNGEVLVNNARFSGGSDALRVFSADHTFTGLVNRTSVAL